MKKLFLFMAVPLVLLGSGCGDPDRAINLQQDKELKIIEAQKQKEEDVLNRQHELQVQEEKDKQVAIDGCLATAKNRYREHVKFMYEGMGWNWFALTDVQQRTSAEELSCRQKIQKNPYLRMSDCMSILINSESKIWNEQEAVYKLDEANCYARYK